jgi:hypothetical protein
VYNKIRKRETKEIKTMKKLIAVAALFALLIGAGYADSHYTRKDCIVTSVQGDAVCVVDVMGREWEFFADGDAPAVGSWVDLKMYNNNTDANIYDDEVVGFKMAG